MRRAGASRAGAAIVALGAAALWMPVAGGGAAAQDVPPPTGHIAYLEGRERVHVIGADGRDDTVVFGIQPDAPYGIESVAWRPDGKRLAIASGHEALCSIWRADLYTMAADGTDVQRLTNGPSCGAQQDLPTGSVRITVANGTSDTSDFLVRIQGLDTAQGVTVKPGFQSTFEIPGVHDLGPDTPQFVVVSSGDSTWFDPNAYADVQAGATADAGTLVLGTDSYDTWGALSVSWSHDGSRLAYQQGLGGLWQIPASAGQLDVGTPLFTGTDASTIAGTTPTFAPLDDRVLYQRFDQTPSTIDIGTAGASRPGDAIAPVTVTNGFDWLPDGSGFIASESSELLDRANLVEYDLRTGAVTPITGFTSGFALFPTVSPDGRYVAYTYSDQPLDSAEAVELRVRHLASGAEQVLAANGLNADWGP
ncbi:MAG: hypothetical protein U0869_02230 [Chloroflexota bacterium]